MRFIVFILLFTAACVPKPEEIKGCGSGTEFNETSKSCVTIASIDLDSTLTALAVTEDDPESFSLPNATTDSVEGTLFWFITEAPEHGTLTACANLDVSGDLTSTGTVFRSCVYTPDANYVGPDSFSYRICSSADARKRCTTSYTVDIDVSDDENDVPILGGPAEIQVNEGNVFAFDLRVSRRTADEADDFYLCVDVVDPTGALDTPVINDSLNPVTLNDPTCTLLGAEDDNLANVMATFSSDTNSLPGGVPKTAYVMMRLCENTTCTDGVDNDGDTLIDEADECLTCRVRGIDGVDNDADTLIDEEDEWNTTDLANVSVVRTRVNVLDVNFAPVMMLGGFPTFAPVNLGSILEDSLGVGTASIGTAGTNTFVVPTTAVDPDGDTFQYELVPLSFFPSHAGVLLCPSGVELACTFDPADDFSGTISFRYRARDSTNRLSNEISVTLTFTGVNDPPVFLASQVLNYENLTGTHVFLTEVTTLADRTFKVGEGGGITENNQTLRLRATSSDPTILAPQGIRVKRNGVELGLLSDVTDLIIDSPATDADALAYTLSFRPNGFTVTDTPVVITLSLNDGFTTTTLDIRFLGVTNLNSPVLVDMPTSLGIKAGGTKNLEMVAMPGLNDWDDVTGGGQGLAVTVTSSNTAVIDLTATDLTVPPAVTWITITKDVGNCTQASCLYNITYDGSDYPGDDIMTLALTAGIRGNSTLTLSFSDGVGAPVVRTVAVGSYSFAVSFNGWSFLNASGPKTNADGSVFEAGQLTAIWQNLTVTEGGVQTTAYKVFVYRKSNSDFSDITDYPAAPINEEGVPANTNLLTVNTGEVLFDTTTIVPGERFYLALAIVPDALGEMIVAPSVVDTAIEVVMPPDNMALVHRWSANRAFCSILGATVDRNNNYRCLNAGLAGIEDGAAFYYDAKDHVFVDSYESGCPYTGSNVEDGLFMPPGASGEVHYNRNTGACSYSNGAAWLPFSQAAYVLNPALRASRGRLPPLTGLTRTQAQAVCGSEVPQCEGTTCPNTLPTDVWTGATRELPSRVEMMTANSWNFFETNSAQYEDSGLHTPSLLSCNTNSAAGQAFEPLVDTLLTDGTITATSSSTVRSLSNSAAVTANCKSLFNVHNLIGNVGEWLADSYSCANASATEASCDMLAPVGSQAGGPLDLSVPTNNSLTVAYSFNGTTGHGPLLIKNTSTLFANLFRPTIDRLHLGVGLPFYEDGSVPHPSPGLPRIGTNAPPASYATTIFASDSYRLDWLTPTTIVDPTTHYAMVQGGDWLSGAGAGRYNFELKQDSAVSTRVGHRCVVRLTPELNP